MSAAGRDDRGELRMLVPSTSGSRFRRTVAGGETSSIARWAFMRNVGDIGFCPISPPSAVAGVGGAAG